jgi:hypothetical protein
VRATRQRMVVAHENGGYQAVGLRSGAAGRWPASWRPL